MSKPHLIFICTENSARSLMAEAIAKHSFGDRFDIASAGTSPHQPDIRALEAIKRHGLSAAGLRSKSLNEFAGLPIEYAIILCSKAKLECADGLEAKKIMAWDFPDPKLGASDKSYDTTMHELSERIKMFVLLYDKDLSNQQQRGN
jgi:ArsR family transcriptional regulator